MTTDSTPTPAEPIPFKPETWPVDADGFTPDLCTECGTPVRYGSRHTKCAPGWRATPPAAAEIAQPAAPESVEQFTLLGPGLMQAARKLATQAQPATHAEVLTDALTDRELQSLRNMGNEAERAADEIVSLRAAIATQAAQQPKDLGVPASPSGSSLQPPSSASAAIPDAAGEVQSIKLKSPMWDMPSEELRKIADREHSKPEPGAWLLQSPSGRQFTADSPMRCLLAEQRTRVPADVALARIILGSREDE